MHFRDFFFGLLGPFGPKSASSYHKTMVSEKKLGRNLFCAHWRAAVATGRGRTFSVLSQCGAPQPAACKILGIFFSKFLYVRDFPEYTYNIVRIQGYIVCVLKSHKTYSRYLKKIRPSEFFLLICATQ